MIKKTFVKALTFDSKGNKILQYVDQDKLRSSIGENRNLTPEMYEHIIKKIGWLKDQIQRCQDVIDGKVKPWEDNEPTTEWEMLMFRYYQDECRIDLREDEHLLEYKGNIPKHIDERCINRASKIYDKYRKTLGNEKFLQLKEDVDTMIRGDVKVDIEPTTGGGKV